MKSYTLNNGASIPAIGLGVWQIADAELCAETVSFALRQGYRLIDTATVYQNEAPVGEGIRRSGVPREEIFVTSKLLMPNMDEIEDATEAAQDAYTAVTDGDKDRMCYVTGKRATFSMVMVLSRALAALTNRPAGRAWIPTGSVMVNSNFFMGILPFS